ncbi:hypothetical protein AB3Y40_16375 [Yoonia sp. R2331]|uniref:hypothetical protein n=1 Tax=Yoonia sp. R2331 TaxID=3237238 RepID=UPI0034E5832E
MEKEVVGSVVCEKAAIDKTDRANVHWDRAKAWSDYLGYHARAFFFLTLGFICLAQMQGEVRLASDGPDTVLLLQVAAFLSFSYAAIMFVFVIGVTHHFLNVRTPDHWLVSPLIGAAGVIYSAMVGSMFWAIGRMAAIRLSDLLDIGIAQ